jgi:hypothetical protein
VTGQRSNQLNYVPNFTQPLIGNESSCPDHSRTAWKTVIVPKRKLILASNYLRVLLPQVRDSVHCAGRPWSEALVCITFLLGDCAGNATEA